MKVIFYRMSKALEKGRSEECSRRICTQYAAEKGLAMEEPEGIVRTGRQAVFRSP